MASHPFKPDGSKLPLILSLGGMIILGIITTTLGMLFWSEPVYEADESTEGMFLTAPATEADAGAADAGADAGAPLD